MALFVFTDLAKRQAKRYWATAVANNLPYTVSRARIWKVFLLTSLNFYNMEDIKIFQNDQFGQVRVALDENNEPLFCAKDIAEALGYSDTNDAIARHCKSGNKVFHPHPNGIGGVNLIYILEKDVFRLIMRSNLPDAERFQYWVCDDVLPSIRKHGESVIVTSTTKISGKGRIYFVSKLLDKAG